MKLTASAALSQEQKRQAKELASLCRSHDGSSLSFPLEDGEFFVLICEENVLACALGFCRMEPHLLEVSAFTRPEFRRQGLFSRALACGESYFPDDDFSFVSDGKCPAAAFVLRKLNARLWYREHMMRLDFAGWQPPVCLLPPAFSMEETEDGFTAWIGGKEAGVCFVSPMSGVAYFYGFKIYTPFRGKGYGKAFFLQVLKRLKEESPAVLLQVSGDNAVALRLYEKTGFRITETLSYYLY